MYIHICAYYVHMHICVHIMYIHIYSYHVSMKTQHTHPFECILSVAACRPASVSLSLPPIPPPPPRLPSASQLPLPGVEKVSKETYLHGKRDLFTRKNRPIKSSASQLPLPGVEKVSKETYLHGKRDLFTRQKRPIKSSISNLPLGTYLNLSCITPLFAI